MRLNLRAGIVRTFVPEELSESSPLSGSGRTGLAFFKELSVPDGTIDEYLQSLSRVQDQKPRISIVPNANGTDLFFASFPSPAVAGYWATFVRSLPD